MDARAQITIKGRVQGVGFRYFAVDEARKLGLVGTVQNLYNGDVKVVAEGDKSAIHALIKSLRVGPSHANVQDVVVDFEEYKNEFKNFRII